MLEGIDRKILSVLQADAGLVAHEVDVHLIFADVLCPGAVEGDDGAFGTDHAGDGIIHIISAAVIRRTCPHILIGIVFHILTQHAEGFAGNGQRLGIAAAVHNDIQEVNAPVDQRAAAGDGLGGKGTAQTGNGTVRTEADVNMVDVAQLAIINDLLDQVHIVVETVDHADVQHLAGLMLCLLHFQSFRIGTGCRLFAQHMLARPEAIDGDGGMDIIGRTDGNGLHFGICQYFMIVRDGLAAAIGRDGLLGTLGENIAEIEDLSVLVLHIRGDMGIVGNGAAADHSNFDGFHHKFRLSLFRFFGCLRQPLRFYYKFRVPACLLRICKVSGYFLLSKKRKKGW